MREYFSVVNREPVGASVARSISGDYIKCLEGYPYLMAIDNLTFDFPR